MLYLHLMRYGTTQKMKLPIFLLKIVGDVTFVAITKDSIFQGFDVIIKDNDKLDALRCGVLKYALNKTD